MTQRGPDAVSKGPAMEAEAIEPVSRREERPKLQVFVMFWLASLACSGPTGSNQPRRRESRSNSIMGPDQSQEIVARYWNGRNPIIFDIARFIIEI